MRWKAQIPKILLTIVSLSIILSFCLPKITLAQLVESPNVETSGTFETYFPENSNLMFQEDVNENVTVNVASGNLNGTICTLTMGNTSGRFTFTAQENCVIVPTSDYYELAWNPPNTISSGTALTVASGESDILQWFLPYIPGGGTISLLGFYTGLCVFGLIGTFISIPAMSVGIRYRKKWIIVGFFATLMLSLLLLEVFSMADLTTEESGGLTPVTPPSGTWTYTNLVANPGFELNGGVGTAPTSWAVLDTWFPFPGPCPPVVNNTIVHNGTYALYMHEWYLGEQGSAQSAQFSLPGFTGAFAWTPGSPLQAGCYVYGPVSYSGSAANLQIFVNWYSDSGSFMGATTIFNGVLSGSSTWTLYNSTVTPPLLCHYATLNLVLLQENSTPIPGLFFDDAFVTAYVYVS